MVDARGRSGLWSGGWVLFGCLAALTCCSAPAVALADDEPPAEELSSEELLRMIEELTEHAENLTEAELAKGSRPG